MKIHFTLIKMILVLGMATFFNISVLHAGEWDGGLRITLPSELTSLPLAADVDSAKSSAQDSAKTPSSKSISMGDMHKYMGYATVGLAIATAVSSSKESIHKTLAVGTSVGAVMTCTTGFMEYSDYFQMDQGISKYNVHIVSGVAATAGFIAATVLGFNDKKHGEVGATSTVLAAVPVIILKW